MRSSARCGPEEIRSRTEGSERADPNSSMDHTEQISVVLGQTKQTQDLCQTKQTQGRPWARPSRPNINPWPDRTDPRTRSDRTDPRPTLNLTDQTQGQPWARPNRPKTNPGRDRTHQTRPTLVLIRANFLNVTSPTRLTDYKNWGLLRKYAWTSRIFGYGPDRIYQRSGMGQTKKTDNWVWVTPETGYEPDRTYPIQVWARRRSATEVLSRLWARSHRNSCPRPRSVCSIPVLGRRLHPGIACQEDSSTYNWLQKWGLMETEKNNRYPSSNV